MTSRAQNMYNLFARYVQKPTLGLVSHQPTLSRIFEATAAVIYPRLTGCAQRFSTVEQLRIRRMIPKKGGDNLVLWFHGGGFTIGSSFTHRWMAARLAEKIGGQAWVPDYRLAPAHPHPAAQQDCLAAYRYALAHYPAERIILAGDSAGGCLVLNICLQLQELDLPKPAAVALLSPLTDLSGGFESRTTFRDTDMILPRKWVDRALTAYLGDANAATPALSPAFADLSDIPPASLHWAKGEMLSGDAEHLAKTLPVVDCHEAENVPHVWQLAAGRSPEADHSLDLMAAYLKQHLP